MTTNDELGRQLAAQLLEGDRKLALDAKPSAGQADDAADENPLETDFFRAMNAFRAARKGGDPDEIAAAERHLQAVVRGELTGEGCEA